MEQALGLAENNHGLTGENPSVGCVLVKNNQIISTGVTGLDGRPHAEANAIKNSLTNVQGSTLYVTLAPCNHYGKTPPCTNLIKNVFFFKFKFLSNTTLTGECCSSEFNRQFNLGLSEFNVL